MYGSGLKEQLTLAIVYAIVYLLSVALTLNHIEERFEKDGVGPLWAIIFPIYWFWYLLNYTDDQS